MFKEVKRKAAAGERIKIVKPRMTFGKYKAGDVFVVDRADRSIGVYVDAVKYSRGNGTGLITHKEYVVLEPIAPAAPSADLTQAFAQFIRENASAIRKYLDEIDPPQPAAAKAEPDAPKPLTRAEVIDKARKDVEEITEYVSGGRGWRVGVKGDDGLCSHNVDFIVNREKRTVVALLSRKISGRVHAKGIAKCAPGDVFHAEIGKAIALRKALGLTIPAEYTDAPQPDERCEGQIIACGEETLKLISPPRYPKDGEAHVGSYSGMTGIIIDDTDADYEEAA